LRGRKAVALAYAQSEPAPRVVVSVRGRAAERVLESARAAGVPIVEDAALVQLLEPLDCGTLVPEPYWEAVARVLALVMDIEEGL